MKNTSFINIHDTFLSKWFFQNILNLPTNTMKRKHINYNYYYICLFYNNTVAINIC